MIRHQLIQGDCLDYLLATERTFQCIFSDPPDNLGLAYHGYRDKLPEEEYRELLRRWLDCFVRKARTVWLSYNSRRTFLMGALVTELLARHPGLEAKACVQVFTFGQHNHHDLGNNHRPLLRLRWPDAPLYPDRIRVPSQRQLTGDKRADPRGRVPGDVACFEIHGRDTLPLPNWTPNDVERFLSKINRAGAEECWEWTACKRAGYGRFRIGDSLYVATRLMWRLTHGVDPAGQLVLHTCDNPGCCNPNHLFLGSDADNNDDKEAKQRGNHPIGEANGLAKLSTEDVITIYQSVESPAILAKRYGVTDISIRSIQNGKTWQHITQSLPLSDVFNMPRVTGNSRQRRRWHPTQLSEDLVERCIRLCTQEGDAVLDPFAGTGTTLRVCRRIERFCSLIELDPFYCGQIAAEEHLDLEILHQ